MAGSRLRQRLVTIAVALTLAWLSAPGAARAADVETVLSAIVGLRAEIPEDARTARFLGTEREGSGVVIDSHGLVLTIGYLILEAMGATVIDRSGQAIPAEIVAYDYDTGFGLVRAMEPLGATPLRLGDSREVEPDDAMLAISFGGAGSVLPTMVGSRREFAGYWEYLLESAIYTSPPHPFWAGAALVGPNGRLVGIGSLLVDDPVPGSEQPGNMFVPIDLLKPILGDMLTTGRAATPPRPWLGMFTREAHGQIMVTRSIPEGPADRAGIEPGERVTAVAGEPVGTMAEMFRKIWSLGTAGVQVPLTLDNNGRTRQVTVQSADRYQYLRLDPSY